MIQGLQVEVQSDELKRIIQGRIEYHRQKAEAYGAKAAELRSTMKNIEEDMEFAKTSQGDPAQQMEQKTREHKDKADFFQFTLDHVIQNDVYRLGSQDLERLGISPVRGFY